MDSLVLQIPILQPDLVIEGARKAMSEYNALGVTTVYEGHTMGEFEIESELTTEIEKHKAAAPAEREKVQVNSAGLPRIKHNADGRGFPHFYKETFFLKRGDATQKVRAADPGFLQVLTSSNDVAQQWQVSSPDGWHTSYQRRSLANWITDTEAGAGHLLARVIVNRLWQHHMGRGIVSTPNDFGKQGELPSHPELLDWLAQQLIDANWRLKPIHRLILTSSAYRQSSAYDDRRSKRIKKLSL